MHLLRWCVTACLLSVAAEAATVPETSASASTTTTLPGASSSNSTMSVPLGITTGPDGALWFTNLGTKSNPGSIGEITTSGKVTLYTGTGIDGPAGIAAGPDGDLWFTNSGNNSIGRITTTGKITTYTAAGIANPFGIVNGPDGDLWFTDFNSPGSFGQVTMKGKITIHTSSDIDEPFGITTGPGGTLWIATEAATKTRKGSIAEIAPSKKTSSTGKVTVYTKAGVAQPTGITQGPDGALWFTNYAGNSIGRITTAGKGTIFTGKGIDKPYLITSGPDGAVWFTNYADNAIGRITTSGTVSIFTGNGIDAPADITAGPDGALWFTNSGNNSVGRITDHGTSSTTSDWLPPETSAEETSAGPGFDRRLQKGHGAHATATVIRHVTSHHWLKKLCGLEKVENGRVVAVPKANPYAVRGSRRRAVTPISAVMATVRTTGTSWPCRVVIAATDSVK